jgi:predicted extracellular nuclease
LGTASLDLSDYKLGDAATPGSAEGMMRFPEGASLEAGEVIVVAQTAAGFAAVFGGLPDYEVADSDAAVSDMRPYDAWSSGDFRLSNLRDEVLVLGPDDNVIDATNYGDSVAFFDPAVGPALSGQSLERIPAHCDSDTATDWQPQIEPTPGEIILDGDCRTPFTAAQAEVQPIGAIQGDGNTTPYLNQIVAFRGVVTGALADQNTAGTIFYTLFVQDLPGEEDGDPATSDGIAVFLGTTRPTYPPGTQVRVAGRATEFFGFTEIEDDRLQIVVEAENVPLPDPIPIDPPADSDAQHAYFEPLEGMRVSLTPAQVVGATHSGCGFAVVRAAGDAPIQVRRSRLEDPIGQVVPVLPLTDVDCSGALHVKSGDRIENLVGPVVYNFDQFKIVPEDPDSIAISSAELQPLPPPLAVGEGQFAVVTFNVHDYFDTLKDTVSDGEPLPTEAELGVKKAKLAYAIGTRLGCPTLLGIQEVEKASLLQELTLLLAEPCGFVYQVTHVESLDTRGIDNALLSDPDRVVIQSAMLRQGCGMVSTNINDPGVDCPAGEEPLFDRPPLQVELTVDGERYILFVNHFKSKREGEQETALWRLLQARHQTALAAGLLAQDPTARLIVMGDFNDYEASPPLLAMTDAAEGGVLANALLRVPERERYSYNFGGVAQLLDTILVSTAVDERIAQVTILHLNADYPAVLASDTSPEGLPYHVSDHDVPVIVIASEVVDNLPATEEMSVPAVELAPTSTPTPAGEGFSGRWWLIGAIGVALLGVLVLLVRRRG